MKIENYQDLTTKLLDLYASIEDEQVALKKAKALQVTASTIVSTFKTKVLYDKTRNNNEKIAFLETK